MRITSVEAIPIRTPAAPPDYQRTWWVTTPFSHFTRTEDLLRQRFYGAGDRIDNLLVLIETDEGQRGIGNVLVGVHAAKAIIDSALTPILAGQDPFDVELLWETMFRSTLNFGRKGAAIEAISGVDIALWDLLGKAGGQPVWSLLGGDRDRVEAYAAGGYYGQEERLRELAAEIERLVLYTDHDSYIRAGQISPRIAPEGVPAMVETPEARAHLENMLVDFERRVITETLRRNDYNVARAATALGLGSRQTLYKKLKRLAINVGDFLQDDQEPGLQRRAEHH